LSTHAVTVVTRHAGEALDWVTLIYRVPREPSSPRIAIWRKLRALGVVQLGDGAVALPEDARTREHLEWVADQVVEAGGTALLLRAQTLARRDERALARAMSTARAEEYRDLTDRAAQVVQGGPTAAEVTRALKRLRSDLRAIQKRDYFPPAERDDAIAAIHRLAESGAAEPASTSGDRS
jgi:hypothetical protein